ncbi:MAG: ABC transporter substrate-binding protein [Kiritimatiellia bacterium]|nr:ABC transporter substrate-binding protein [Kiritimatiellia bacterium]
MSIRHWMAAATILLAGGSCSTIRDSHAPPLRVGITPNYPPLIMMRADKAAGVECDFARQLAADLGRPLQLVALPWELQFEELDEGRVDILMSGLTVTPARRSRVAFCDSYMDNPLVAVVRRGESGRYATAEAVERMDGKLGVLKDTSADAYVRRMCQNAKILPLSVHNDAAFYLVNQRLDVYVCDLAVAVDLVTRNESRLELVPISLKPQQLAWAVRSDNAALKQQANAALTRWRAGGTLDRILNRWMPYRPALDAVSR